jgi:hypothetical protein
VLGLVFKTSVRHSVSQVGSTPTSFSHSHATNVDDLQALVCKRRKEIVPDREEIVPDSAGVASFYERNHWVYLGSFCSAEQMMH